MAKNGAIILYPRYIETSIFSFNLDINKFFPSLKFLKRRRALSTRFFSYSSSPFSQEANLVLFSILLATSVRPKSEARVAARYLPVWQLGYVPPRIPPNRRW